jgi:SAM-dependent methyltransferase
MADLKETRDNMRRHPWELSRAHEVLRIIKKILRNDRTPRAYKIADIGAGDLFFDKFLIRRLGNAEVDAVDKAFETLESDVPEIRKTRDYRALPENEYDVIILMDIMEHIEDDSSFVADIKRKLKPGGYLVITVPAHQRLFSNHDIYFEHFRRYGRETLEGLLRGAGLDIVEIRYFFISLYFARVLSRRYERPVEEQRGIGAWRYGGLHPITVIIYAFLLLDILVGRALQKCGLPCTGLSLLALCGNK